MFSLETISKVFGIEKTKIEDTIKKNHHLYSDKIVGFDFSECKKDADQLTKFQARSKLIIKMIAKRIIYELPKNPKGIDLTELALSLLVDMEAIRRVLDKMPELNDYIKDGYIIEKGYLFLIILNIDPNDSDQPMLVKSIQIIINDLLNNAIEMQIRSGDHKALEIMNELNSLLSEGEYL